MRKLTWREALRTTDLKSRFKENGMEHILAAKAKMAGIQVHPDLLAFLLEITPKGTEAFPVGHDYLKDDELWKLAAYRLGFDFDKRGMARYFITYLKTMSIIAQLVPLETNAKVMSLHQNDFGSMLAVYDAAERVKDVDEIMAAQLGYLNFLEDQIPEKPRGLVEKIYVWAWRSTDSATKADFDDVRTKADEFLIKSMDDPKIIKLIKPNPKAQ